MENACSAHVYIYVENLMVKSYFGINIKGGTDCKHYKGNSIF